MFLSRNVVWRTLLVCGAVAWSAWASVPFVSAAVPAARRALAVYPVILFLISLGVLAAVSA
jgi:hypothetical protein